MQGHQNCNRNRAALSQGVDLRFDGDNEGELGGLFSRGASSDYGTDSEAEDDCEEPVYSPTRRSKDRSAEHKIYFDLDGAKAAIKERERDAREEALRERT